MQAVFQLLERRGYLQRMIRFLNFRYPSYSKLHELPARALVSIGFFLFTNLTLRCINLGM